MQQRFTKLLSKTAMAASAAKMAMAASALVFAFSLTALADGMDEAVTTSQKARPAHVALKSPARVAKTIRLTTGMAETVELPKAVADVLVANPSIADVGSLRANRLYIVGKAIGDTNVLAFDDTGNQLADIAVHVRVDESSLRDSLHEFFPDEKLEVHTVNDSIVLNGSVSNPSVANQVRDLAGRFIKTSGQTLVDLMTVRGEQQVMLKVKVVEARRDILREYGIDTTLTGRAGDARGVFDANTGVGLTSLTQFGSGTLAVMGGSSVGPVNVNIQGLERDGLINTLAEPTLTAISGESAGFLAGGEFPVPSGRDTSGNVSIEFKQFGVSLNFIPTVMGRDRISMQLTSEVSEKSDQDSVTLVNTIIPGLTVRRAQTTVQMASGGTLMMAGLLKSRTVDAVNGFPGLKDLPIIGELFKSKSFQRGESELVFLVTPYIVEPYALPQAERVTAMDEHTPPRPILSTSGNMAPEKAVIAPAASTANPPALPATRFNNLPSAAPASPEAAPSYRRQGEEERTAGTRKVDATPVTPLPGTEAPPKVAANDRTPKPQKTAAVSSGAHLAAPKNIAEELTAEEMAAAPVEAAPVAPVDTLALATAPEPDPVTAVPVKTAAARKAPTAGKSLALAGSKPAAAAKPASVKTAQLPDIAPAAGNDDDAGADPLKASFAKGLQKVYGNKAPVLGGEAAYGYIVD